MVTEKNGKMGNSILERLDRLIAKVKARKSRDNSEISLTKTNIVDEEQSIDADELLNQHFNTRFSAIDKIEGEINVDDFWDLSEKEIIEKSKKNISEADTNPVDTLEGEVNVDNFWDLSEEEIIKKSKNISEADTNSVDTLEEYTNSPPFTNNEDRVISPELSRPEIEGSSEHYEKSSVSSDSQIKPEEVESKDSSLIPSASPTMTASFYKEYELTKLLKNWDTKHEEYAVVHKIGHKNRQNYKIAFFQQDKMLDFIENCSKHNVNLPHIEKKAMKYDLIMDIDHLKKIDKKIEDAFKDDTKLKYKIKLEGYSNDIEIITYDKSVKNRKGISEDEEDITTPTATNALVKIQNEDDLGKFKESLEELREKENNYSAPLVKFSNKRSSIKHYIVEITEDQLEKLSNSSKAKSGQGL